MPRIILVSCETIEDEIQGALERLGLDYPIIWLSGGLHNNPDNLRRRMEEVLKEVEGQCELLLAAVGYCGGGISGLATGNYTTVLPLADDCLSILMGSLAARQRASRPATYFLTEGWMRHENNVITSNERTLEKYGPEKTARLNKMMLKHYDRFGVIDTGCYNVDKAMDKVRPLAGTVDMKVETLPGESSWLDNLLLGPYDDSKRFLVIPPRGKLTFAEWKDLLEHPDLSSPQA